MSEIKADFGIVIACCVADAHYAKACYQSVRHFLGDIPVCFVIDGEEAILGPILTDTGVSCITRANTRDAWLKEHAYGWGHTKMVALWEAPFERFLYMDADTIVWGDVLGIAADADYDAIVDQQQSYSDSEIDFWFFNTKLIAKYFPEFTYEDYRDRYACTGTYFFRTKALPLDLYKHAYTLQQQNLGFFEFGEMGLWNFMVFYETQKNSLAVRSVTYQVIPVDHSEEEMRAEYSPHALGTKDVLRPAVLHFCGKKAHIFSNSARVAAMNYFRLQFLLLRDGLPLWKAVVQMAVEDMRWVFWAKAKKGWKKLLRIIKNRLAKLH